MLLHSVSLPPYFFLSPGILSFLFSFHFSQSFPPFFILLFLSVSFHSSNYSFSSFLHIRIHVSPSLFSSSFPDRFSPFFVFSLIFFFILASFSSFLFFYIFPMHSIFTLCYMCISISIGLLPLSFPYYLYLLLLLFSCFSSSTSFAFPTYLFPTFLHAFFILPLLSSVLSVPLLFSFFPSLFFFLSAFCPLLPPSPFLPSILLSCTFSSLLGCCIRSFTSLFSSSFIYHLPPVCVFSLLFSFSLLPLPSTAFPSFLFSPSLFLLHLPSVSFLLLLSFLPSSTHSVFFILRINAFATPSFGRINKHLSDR